MTARTLAWRTLVGRACILGMVVHALACGVREVLRR